MVNVSNIGKWEDYPKLVEFAYNNNFQFSAGMSPFEILYMGISVILQSHGETLLID